MNEQIGAARASIFEGALVSTVAAGAGEADALKDGDALTVALFRGEEAEGVALRLYDEQGVGPALACGYFDVGNDGVWILIDEQGCASAGLEEAGDFIGLIDRVVAREHGEVAAFGLGDPGFDSGDGDSATREHDDQGKDNRKWPCESDRRHDFQYLIGSVTSSPAFGRALRVERRRNDGWVRLQRRAASA